MAEAIEVWWPMLNEQIRSWVVNNPFASLAPYTLKEIERVGGPGVDDPYWKRDADGVAVFAAGGVPVGRRLL